MTRYWNPYRPNARTDRTDSPARVAPCYQGGVWGPCAVRSWVTQPGPMEGR
jgi:hypothetical protein